MGFGILIQVLVVNKIIRKIFTMIRTKFKSKRIQLLVVLLALFFYLHLYYFIFVDTKITYYQNVELSNKASDQQINKAFKKYSKLYHPDRNPQGAQQYLFYKDIFEILRNKDSKWLYDRFEIKIKEYRSKSIESMLIGNYTNFLVETIMNLVMVLIVGFSGNNLYFKEIMLYCLAMMSLVTYMYFIKEGTDVLDLLFPQMTIFQIKACIWGNFIIIERVLEYILEYYIYNLKNTFLSSLKKLRKKAKQLNQKIGERSDAEIKQFNLVNSGLYDGYVLNYSGSSSWSCIHQLLVLPRIPFHIVFLL